MWEGVTGGFWKIRQYVSKKVSTYPERTWEHTPYSSPSTLNTLETVPFSPEFRLFPPVHQIPGCLPLNKIFNIQRYNNPIWLHSGKKKHSRLANGPGWKMHFLLKMGIFHCYVSLLVGNSKLRIQRDRHPRHRIESFLVDGRDHILQESFSCRFSDLVMF